MSNMEEVLTTIGSQDVQKSTVGNADTTPGFGCQDEDLFLPGSLRYILIAFGLVLMIENISMIVTIIRHRKLRTNSNILVASLAFSDVLIGLLCFEMGLISEPGGVRSNIKLSEFAQRTFDTLGSGTNCGLIAISMVHLAALSVDRYLFLLWPLHYHHRVTQRRVAMAAAAIWTLGCGYTLLPIGLYAHPQYHTRCIIHNTPVEYEGAPLTCILVSCITVVSVCTFGIAKLAFGHSRKREIRNNGAVATDNDIVDGNKKATYLSRGNNGAIYTVNNIPELSKGIIMAITRSGNCASQTSHTFPLSRTETLTLENLCAADTRARESVCGKDFWSPHLNINNGDALKPSDTSSQKTKRNNVEAQIPLDTLTSRNQLNLKQGQNILKQGKSRSVYKKSKFKILKFVIMMVGCYLVCVFPSLVVLVFGKLSHMFHFSKNVIVSATLFLFTNSGVNFLIMLHMKKCFRETFLNSFPYKYLFKLCKWFSSDNGNKTR